MEPLTTSAVALATVVGIKVLEKTGENVGQLLWDKVRNFLESLNQESPDMATAIERVAEHPLDYGEAVLEIESAAQTNSKFARNMEELAAAGKANPHPKFAEIMEEIKEALKYQKQSIYNDNKAKLQDKGIINQGVIHKQDVTF